MGKRQMTTSTGIDDFDFIVNFNSDSDSGVFVLCGLLELGTQVTRTLVRGDGDYAVTPLCEMSFSGDFKGCSVGRCYVFVPIRLNDFGGFHAVLTSARQLLSFQDLYGIDFSVAVQVESLNNRGEGVCSVEVFQGFFPEFG